MERLWAPWRLELIESEKPEGCIFCRFFAERDDEKNLVLGRSASSYVVLNKYPYNNGHLMVIPAAHHAALEELDDRAYDDLQRLLRISIRVVREVYTPDAMNVGMNLGRAAGAGIADHLHWHVVPRWNGDTNFMPVLAETRVLPEHLQAAWKKLRPAFDRALAG
ncbi:MAG: HIT domain-containing protein [Pseudomonadota bacterium]|nr:MAG: HIT family hydrolase [Pseudomonadota bacterium]